MPRTPVSAAELWCLGVGDGRPCPDRRRSSYLYSVGGKSLLVDCGEGCCRELSAQGFPYDQIGHVILSHMHSDHVGSFSLLIQDLWLAGPRRPLPISAPASAVPHLQEWLCRTLLFPDLMPFQINWTPLQAGVPFRSGPARITPYPTRHLESLAAKFKTAYPATCFDAFSFHIEAGGKRVAHTADIGHEDDLDPLLAKPLDLLVCELSHVSPEKIFGKLQGRKIGQIAFIHLTDALWTHRATLKRQAAKALGPIPFRFAKDGERIAF